MLNGVTFADGQSNKRKVLLFVSVIMKKKFPSGSSHRKCEGYLSKNFTVLMLPACEWPDKKGRLVFKNYHENTVGVFPISETRKMLRFYVVKLPTNF